MVTALPVMTPLGTSGGPHTRTMLSTAIGLDTTSGSTEGTFNYHNNYYPMHAVWLNTVGDLLKYYTYILLLLLSLTVRVSPPLCHCDS